MIADQTAGAVTFVLPENNTDHSLNRFSAG
jgi:hypothetical protein